MGTAKGLYKNKNITHEAKRRIFEALKEADTIFDFNSNVVFAVTTEAMRIALNAKEILDEIKQEFGIDFKIIDGKEEAKLTRIGVENALKDIKLDSYVLFDLGGGSCELSFVNKNDILSKSFPFGIVKLAEKYKNIKDIKLHIPNDLKVVDEFIKNKSADKLIATAGTPTTVCAFLQGMDYNSYDYTKINGKSLHVEDFTNALEKLLSMDKQTREFWVGTNRGDLVCAGIVIVINIMKKLNFSTCIVSDDGLREGLAISKCKINVI